MSVTRLTIEIGFEYEPGPELWHQRAVADVENRILKQCRKCLDNPPLSSVRITRIKKDSE